MTSPTPPDPGVGWPSPSGPAAPSTAPWAAPGAGPPGPAHGGAGYGDPTYGGAGYGGAGYGGAGYGGAPAYQGWVEAPKPGIVPLRPLTVGDILDGAVAVIRRHPAATLGVSAVASVVLTAASFGLQLLLRDTTNVAARRQLNGGDVLASVGGVFATLLLSFLVGLVVAAFLTAVVGKAALGQPASLASTWAQVRPRLGAVAGSSVLSALVLIGCAVTVIGVPFAVYFAIGFQFVTAIVVLERAGPRTALKRSRQLVKGSWWRIFGIVLLAALIAAVVRVIIGLPFTFAAGGFDALYGGRQQTTGELAIASIGRLVSSTLTLPFSAAVVTLLYLDRRMRVEALDVALQQAAGVPVTRPGAAGYPQQPPPQGLPADPATAPGPAGPPGWGRPQVPPGYPGAAPYPPGPVG